MDPNGKKTERELRVPHEEPADDHDDRAPNDGQKFEFLDKTISIEGRRFGEEPIRVLFKETVPDAFAGQERGKSEVVLVSS